MKHIPFVFVATLVLLAACSPTQPTTPPSAPPSEATVPPTALPSPTDTPTPLPSPTDTPIPLGPLTLTSDVFAHEGDIPARYGQSSLRVEIETGVFFVCENPPESENVSPALGWTNVPPEAESLVLIAGDQMNFAYPDAPADAVFPHWVIYNIPPSSTGLPEGVPAEQTLTDGSLQGVNGYPAPHDVGYGGPCPGPDEKHLYVFTLYALDTVLDLPAGAEMNAVQDAMQGHILAQAELRGYYTGS